MNLILFRSIFFIVFINNAIIAKVPNEFPFLFIERYDIFYRKQFLFVIDIKVTASLEYFVTLELVLIVRLHRNFCILVIDYYHSKEI